MLSLRKSVAASLLPVCLALSAGCSNPPESAESELEVPVSTASSSRLIISLNAKETRRTVFEGETVKIDGIPFRIEAIRAWSGIVRAPLGEPMVVVSVQRGGEPWIEDARLGADAWLSLEDTAIVLRWHEKESGAEKAAARKSLASSDSARWGVRDVNRIHWFNTFAPGTGVETDDGTIVSLTGLQRGPNPADATLEAFVRKGKDSRREVVKPHTGGPESLILFEDPAALESVLVIHGWRDDAAIATWYRKNERVASSPLVPGAVWKAGGATGSVRIEQILKSAAHVAAADSTIDEIVLAGEQRRFRVREATTVRVGDAHVRFIHSGPAPSVAAPDGE